MPNNFEHNTFLIFFLKQKIERHSFNSSDSADYSDPDCSPDPGVFKSICI